MEEIFQVWEKPKFRDYINFPLAEMIYEELRKHRKPEKNVMEKKRIDFSFAENFLLETFPN